MGPERDDARGDFRGDLCLICLGRRRKGEEAALATPPPAECTASNIAAANCMHYVRHVSCTPIIIVVNFGLEVCMTLGA